MQLFTVFSLKGSVRNNFFFRSENQIMRKKRNFLLCNNDNENNGLK